MRLGVLGPSGDKMALSGESVCLLGRVRWAASGQFSICERAILVPSSIFLPCCNVSLSPRDDAV